MNVEHRRLVCTGCGLGAPLDRPWPFRCPGAQPGDDIDHVLTPVVNVLGLAEVPEWRALFADSEPNPFLRYAPLGLATAAA